jgi:hypothetical protein
MSTRILKGAASKFGGDSDEYEMPGANAPARSAKPPPLPPNGGVPSDLHLTGLVSGHCCQGRTHWLMFLFEGEGEINIAARWRIPRDGSNFSRAMAHAAGAGDAKGGAAGGTLNLLRFPTLNHRCEITSGVREAECRALLQNFCQTTA